MKNPLILYLVMLFVIVFNGYVLHNRHKSQDDKDRHDLCFEEIIPEGYDTLVLGRVVGAGVPDDKSFFLIPNIWQLLAEEAGFSIEHPYLVTIEVKEVLLGGIMPGTMIVLFTDSINDLLFIHQETTENEDFSKIQGFSCAFWLDTSSFIDMFTPWLNPAYPDKQSNVLISKKHRRVFNDKIYSIEGVSEVSVHGFEKGSSPMPP